MTLPLTSLVLALAAIAAPAVAAEIKVFSGGAPQDVLKALVPQFEREGGHKVSIEYIVISGMRKRLEDGETPDVVLMPLNVIETLSKSGKLDGASRATLGRLGVSVVVREGGVKPDVSTPDALKAALLGAASVVHANPKDTPSGAHLAKVIEQLGITQAMAPKMVYRNALGGGVEVVAKGEAELGLFPASEVVHVKGVAVVGPLPSSLQPDTVYGAALHAQAAQKAAAAAFIKFLSAPERRKVWKDAGFDPPAD